MVLICLIAFFGAVTVVNAVMIRAAVSTFGGLETESSYKAGLAFAREIAASEAQDKRRWNVTVTLRTTVDGKTRIEIAALDDTHRPIVGHEARARLSHPTDRRLDLVVHMSATGPGRFAGVAEAPSGQRDLIVELLQGDDRMFRSRERVTLKGGGAQ
jgi:nitrogen fixation protein FixH